LREQNEAASEAVRPGVVFTGLLSSGRFVCALGHVTFLDTVGLIHEQIPAMGKSNLVILTLPGRTRDSVPSHGRPQAKDGKSA
jgi:hypothetical protein